MKGCSPAPAAPSSTARASEFFPPKSSKLPWISSLIAASCSSAFSWTCCPMPRPAASANRPIRLNSTSSRNLDSTCAYRNSSAAPSGSNHASAAASAISWK
jgi:hypothetical protein